MFDKIWRGLAATIDSRFKGKHMLYEDHGDKIIVLQSLSQMNYFGWNHFQGFKAGCSLNNCQLAGNSHYCVKLVVIVIRVGSMLQNVPSKLRKL